MSDWTIKGSGPIIAAFVAHWEDVNGAVARPLTLRGGYGVGLLSADRTTLDEKNAQVAAADNAAETASGRKSAGRASLRERIRQFRGAVTGDLAGTEFAKAAPLIPVMTASDAIWTRALDDLIDLWLRINAADIPGFELPLLLIGDYSVADLSAERASLNRDSVESKEATQKATDRRRERDSHLKNIRGKLVRYRKAIDNRLETGHPLRDSLPTLE